MLRSKLFSLAILMAFVTSGFAQLGGTHNYSDTSYIAPRDMSQQGDFLKNQGSFPAKPRDQYQVGFFFGYPYVDGDCPTALRGVGKGIGSYTHGFGVHVRKAMGYVMSVRTSFAYYNMIGLDYQPNANLNNSPTIVNLYSTAPKGYVHNFRSRAFVPSIEALISLNNIMFHTKQQRWNLYGLLGYTALFYKTTMNLTNNKDGYSPYKFEDVSANYGRGWTRQQLRAGLRTMLDDSYETPGEVNDRRAKVFGYNLRHCFSSGLGLEYRMGKSWSLNFEYKRIQTRDDYVDGWFRQSGDLRYPVFTAEWDNIAFCQIGANFNVGNSKKKVPPLWWLNPLEFAYADLAKDRKSIAGMFKVKDDDKDGVLNELDLEPNTPEGCPVDTHGVTADTDGDGVPDCKDKEKLTLQKCFPVDADGVGNCPEPNCCDSLAKQIAAIKKCAKCGEGGDSSACFIGDLPAIQFKANNFQLTKDAEAILSVVAEKIKSNPNCRVKVIGYGYWESDKRSQQLSWERINAVIKYLIEQQGIAEDRLIFEYGRNGDPLSVDLNGTLDSGPNTVPAPHPELRGKAQPKKKRSSMFGRN